MTEKNIGAENLMSEFDKDKIFMQQALSLAKRAKDDGEVPVGAIVVKDGEIIGSGYNLRESNKMATAHAEILAIEEACRKLGSWRLLDCTLYVTLEPCPMCAGAIVNSRIARVVYGVKDSAAGCCGSVVDLNRYPFLHSFSLTSGVCEEDCALLLKEFFRSKRT